MFIDEVEIEVESGRGGDGAVAFRREKYVPRGGPSGGDGGKGGDVVFLCTSNENTLSDFRYKRRLKAGNGQPGGPKGMKGKSGDDLVVEVPLGTIVRDRETDEVLADLTQDGERFVVAQGGEGGAGNIHFKSSTNRAPRHSKPGKEGQLLQVRLELKLLADVGLVGFPSVGKSTLIAAISNARPKIAAYPFTTLVPNLGVVGWKGYREFVVADIPGLIEGASDGQGLGIQFLKHVERTRLLVHVLEVVMKMEGQEDGRDPVGDYAILSRELERFDEGLSQREQMVVLNKIDLPYVREEQERLRAYFEDELGLRFYGISAVTGEGIEELKDAMARRALGVEEEEEAFWE